jgi:hypothetical protein
MVSKVNNFLTKAASIVTVGTAVYGAAKQISGAVGSFSSKAGNFPPGGEAGIGGGIAQAKMKSSLSRDWRVKLSLPAHMEGSDIISMLTKTGGLVFPYTPTININHAANYQPLDIVHSNYPYLAYQNSKVDNLSISANFFVEDSYEARYWVAAVHFLRSLTKMSFGESSNVGSPPAVVKLSGYGDFVFNDVPVVVTSFNLTMPSDVDYIATGLGKADLIERDYWSDADTSDGVSWAPVKSTFDITLLPMYSRKKLKEFSLDKFVNGEYISKDKNGFI